MDAATVALCKRLWREHLHAYKWRLVAAISFMVIVALSVGAQVALVEPAFDEILVSGDALWIWAAPLGFVIASALAGCANYAQSFFMHQIGLSVTKEVQARMFGAILHADLEQIQTDGTGTQLSRFTTDMTYLRDMVIKAFTGLGRDILKVVVLSSAMFYHNWQMSLLAVIFFPISVYPIVRIGRRVRKVSTSNQIEHGHMTAVVDDALKGVRQVKAYNMTAYEEKRAMVSFEAIYKLVLKAAQTRALSYPILDILAGVTLAIVLAWGGLQVRSGEATVGSFMAFFTAVLLAYQPARGIASMNATLQEGVAALRRVFDVIDRQPNIVDAEDAKPLSVSKGAVQLKNVSYAYDADHPVLRDISIAADPGQVVALVGPSGGGKSTLLNLLLRFYDVREGAITIDDQDIRSVTMTSLRDQIGLVTQETLLFNDTIHANIAYGKPGASKDEIIAAAKAAAAHDFITAAPEGYDTKVGEYGMKLSGGQRQRIAIARAMLKNAPILLLDEATSALDTESERQVQAALKNLMQGRTSFVIAHRLSTVRDADMIFVLDHGQVIERGKHDDLVAQDGLYAKLSRLQFTDHSNQNAKAETQLAEPSVTGDDGTEKNAVGSS